MTAENQSQPNPDDPNWVDIDDFEANAGGASRSPTVVSPTPLQTGATAVLFEKGFFASKAAVLFFV
jgi:hypothetical protein